MESFNQLTETDITQRLKDAYTLSRPQTITQAYREAAVLMPFIRVEQDWHLLFIRRSHCANDQHSGQVAFAGGKREKTDQAAQHTALREAHEEIGVAPMDVALLGQLPDHYSYVSGYRITPIVGRMPWPYPIQPEPREVDRVFSIPLAWLANPAHYEIRPRQLNGQDFPIVYFKEYEGELLWGATARMTLSLLEALNVY